MTYVDELANEYKDIMSKYLFDLKQDEALEMCHTFSDKVIQIDTSPEEIVTLHMDLLDDLQVTDGDKIRQSLHIVQEVLIAFGFTYRDYKAMLAKIEVHDKELDVASSLQETMLKTSIPVLDGLEIGAISVPASKVSGDYFNIINHGNNLLSFGVADVIGKGIPAAIAMSMIKFSMDFQDATKNPSEGLKRLNRVVERNVNQNMFITMFYGLYNIETDTLHFSSAGHEPGLIYRNDTNEFEEIDAKGIVLGVTDSAEYEQRQVKLHKGDMLIVCTDGVTELRKHDDTFIDLDDVEDMIVDTKEHHPQDIVQYVYESLTRMQHTQKKDDLTLFILKNTGE